jgi:hypothetical protein
LIAHPEDTTSPIFLQFLDDTTDSSAYETLVTYHDSVTYESAQLGVDSSDLNSKMVANQGMLNFSLL